MRILISTVLLSFLFISVLTGQEEYYYGDKWFYGNPDEFQDTTKKNEYKGEVVTAEPDTNFTYEKYAKFLEKVSDTSLYIVLPVNEFRTTYDSRKIIIGLRHDVDIDLDKAWDFSKTEADMGVRSTYYILHTAPYYLNSSQNMAVHSSRIIPALRSMQNERKMEIGWHNDLVTLQAVYSINPSDFLYNELTWLRSNGINISGTASHGSNYCYTYKYLNYYFFEECTWPVVGQFVNNLVLPLNGASAPMIKGKLSDFGLEYEAYFLNNNKYFSDASITNYVRWNIGMLDLNQLVPGDRVIILLHPIHWHRASVEAGILTFSVSDQISTSIDKNTSTITVTVPATVNRSSLNPVFSLSPGALAKVNGYLQSPGSSTVDFTYPVTYAVYAENRNVINNWTVKVEQQNVTSSEDATLRETFVAYPNPSDGHFTLQFNNIVVERSILEVVNQSGQKVYELAIDKTGSFSQVIDLSHLAKGVYYLRFSGSDSPVTIVLN